MQTLAAVLKGALLDIPGMLLMVLGACLVLSRLAPRASAMRRASGWLAALAFAGVFVLALPVTGWLLLRSLETGVALPAHPASPPGAIVILSGDDMATSPGGVVAPPDVGPLTLQRMRAGAVLHRQTRLPGPGDGRRAAVWRAADRADHGAHP